MKNKMRVNHIVEDFSLASGGIRTVVEELHLKLIKEEKKSVIVTTVKESNDNVLCFPVSNPIYKKWCYAPLLGESLESNKSGVNHIHGVWMYPQFTALKFGVEENVNTVFTPHGMLEPWLWKQGGFKKKIYFNNLIKSNIENSNVIHAITPDERNNLKALLPNAKRIEVIPNLISLNKLPNLVRDTSIEKYILFVGRLHPKKGINLLIQAFSNINDVRFKLKIVGEINAYQKELEKLVDQLGLSKRVEFCGIVTGSEKFKLFKDAWVFVAPSYSEVVGMVNLEAGAMSTPVITTRQTGLLPDWSKNGGELINPDLEELNTALSKAVAWSESERFDRGKSMHQFVEKHYSWEKNMSTWLDLYASL
ncbi:MAG: glycosyltransferase involved in cell wall biosynthesis [Psychroserpens sp.]|jgi:glycosyltransferase involved in cell wall biosynthesis